MPYPVIEKAEDIASRISDDLRTLKEMTLEDVGKIRHMRFEDNAVYGFSRWFSLCKRNLESMDSIINPKRK